MTKEPDKLFEIEHGSSGSDIRDNKSQLWVLFFFQLPLNSANKDDNDSSNNLNGDNSDFT